MNLQVIKSIDGKVEYVLLPVHAYEVLKPQINKVLCEGYVNFRVEDYISSPVALLRINAGLTQQELAKLLKVSQAYISKLEGAEQVSPKIMQKVKSMISKIKK